MWMRLIVILQFFYFLVLQATSLVANRHDHYYFILLVDFVGAKQYSLASGQIKRNVQTGV
jgi:hypothetical protein